MAAGNFKSVDDYIASQPEAVRPILDRVRSAIREAVPKADEAISYNIPAYKLGGDPVIYFAGWKHYYSLYPVGPRIVAALQAELARYQVNKATVRFPLSEPVPVKWIARIAKLRAKEIDGREKPKPVTRKKR
jgi:uncharacterized protein YdhG (YjbR/CyaY superfamily)